MIRGLLLACRGIRRHSTRAEEIFVSKPHPDILCAGDQRLREVCKEVPEAKLPSEEVSNIADHLLRVMRDAQSLGLSAPQLGYSWRIVALHVPEQYVRSLPADLRASGAMVPVPETVYVNPKLKMIGMRRHVMYESCMSLMGFVGAVERHWKVELQAHDLAGRKVVKKVAGFEARLLQHEVDHLDGTLYSERVLPGTLVRDEAFDAEFNSMYAR
mmetsp:Transcript_7736/g.24288  ORF Transcript_7736/g.24288 Transcript_7736/m.24288 type:complete len:214 (+) Transcript_7736:2-643(+)